MLEDSEIIALLKLKGNRLFHREGQTLEFKEQFNLAGLADYFRDFAAFANNRGGCLIFGVTDTPRLAQGLNEKSISSFEKIDPEKISGFLLDIFSSDISWFQTLVEIEGKFFGAFKILEAEVKPVIAKKDEGKEQIIRNGDIYYRYAGRTQRIQSAELEKIISKRIETNNRDWIDLVKKIGPSGPSETVVLKTKNSLNQSSGGNFVIDQDLAQKLKFVREGKFVETAGASTLKLVGELVPVDVVEVEKIIKQNRLEDYPYSATELAEEVQSRCHNINQGNIWKAIKDNNIKGNSDYSNYNFRNNKQQVEYENEGTFPKNTPVIYNDAAIDFLTKVLDD